MAAKRTLGWMSGLTLVTVAAGCASQTPSMSTTPEFNFPNKGPAIIQGDTLIIPADRSVQAASGAVVETRFNSKEFDSLPKRIDANSPEAKNLIPSGGMGAPAPEMPGPGMGGGVPPIGAGAFNLNFPGVWPGPWGGGLGFCPAPYGFAFGTPGIFPKTLFIHPDVYYFRRNALYFPYSRLGGYFYPISVPYGARFYTPFLAYGYGGFSPYTFTSGVCPVGQAFPGGLPCGPGVGPGVGAGPVGGGYIPPGMGDGNGNGNGSSYGKSHDNGKHMGQRMGSRRY